MNQPRIAPYGTWKSPVSLEMVAHGSINLLRVVLDGLDTYWAEVRPAEDGRTVIVKRSPDNEVRDIIPPGFSSVSMVNEYGTRSFTVSGGVVYFSNSEDQRVYRQRPGEQPVAITPEGDFRYGSKVLDRGRARIICIRENHRDSDEDHPLSEIVALDANGADEPQVLLSDNDFHSSPCLSPDGAQLAWLTWDHPNMPWDGTELWTAAFNEDGSLGEATLVAGGVDEAIIQPEWSPSGELFFISDRSNWANIYRWRDGQVEPVWEVEAEFARANWWVGTCSYGFDSPASLVCSYARDGFWRLARIVLNEGDNGHQVERTAFPYWEMGHGDLQVDRDRVVLVAGSPGHPLSLLEFTLDDKQLRVLRVESEEEIPSGYLSMPEAIEFLTAGGRTSHAFFYPPANQDYVAPEGEKPPLLVTCHGGPHSAASAELNLTTQILDQPGLRGAGRQLRRQHRLRQGVPGTSHRRMGRGGRGRLRQCRHIRGGAWRCRRRPDCHQRRQRRRVTALAALTFRDVFKAGASYFGVSDLEALLSGIHKFDAHSLVGLVGPYPLYRRRYVERSPINFSEYATCPVIFFQGLEDTIVPAIQSEVMYNTLRENGVPTAYLAFEGEHHGFRMAETIMQCLSAEFYFYSRIFGFDPADDLKPVAIENLS